MRVGEFIRYLASWAVVAWAGLGSLHCGQGGGEVSNNALLTGLQESLSDIRPLLKALLKALDSGTITVSKSASSLPRQKFRGNIFPINSKLKTIVKKD